MRLAQHPDPRLDATFAGGGNRARFVFKPPPYFQLESLLVIGNLAGWTVTDLRIDGLEQIAGRKPTLDALNGIPLMVETCGTAGIISIELQRREILSQLPGLRLILQGSWETLPTIATAH